MRLTSASMQLLAFAIALAIGMPSAALASPPSATLSLNNIRIVDAELDRASEPRCLRIENGLIVRIAQAGDRKCLRNSQAQDLAGKYLRPGLIDTHAHLTLGYE